MSEFLAMGGYAFYVWGSFGITAVVLVLNVFLPIIRRKALLKQVAGEISRLEKRHAS